MGKSCLIIGGGDFPNDELFFKLLNNIDVILGVDRGYDYLLKHNIKPDYLIGDFDSTTNIIPETGINIERHPVEKSSTDMELAIDKAISLNCDEVVLLGCTGTRLDHTIINLFLLEKFLKNDIKAKIINNHNEIIMSVGNFKIKNTNFKYFSIVPLENSTTLSISGSKYDLQNYTVKFANSMTISNEFKEGYVNINSNKKVLVILSKD